MTVQQAMAMADELRPNMIEDKTKAFWLYELDGRVAEMMEITPPAFDFPKSHDLLLQAPYESVYVRYLTAMIDYYQGEMSLYDGDMTLFNAAMKDAAAAWRRGHKSKVMRWGVGL